MKPHEDWVDESWTVDCVCGVNFDDGKEMVDCDECGVWVHTWCSRYVKGDDLFVCHKCKIKSNEVVSKFMVTNKQMLFPLKPCSEIPIEERVHVQGVPGGDLGLFECVSSSVFSRQLWKCSGYVPKKFGLKYREFPCWDDDDDDGKVNVCEIGDEEDACAGVLLSLSKENDVDGKEIEMSVKKEKSLLCSLSMNKRRKESHEAFDDSCVKKKVKVADNEEEDDIRRV